MKEGNYLIKLNVTKAGKLKITGGFRWAKVKGGSEMRSAAKKDLVELQELIVKHW